MTIKRVLLSAGMLALTPDGSGNGKPAIMEIRENVRHEVARARTPEEWGNEVALNLFMEAVITEGWNQLHVK
ncbi:hypothetical protein [Pontiella agarivorans]|uniref:Uncharacterized protein n=1 Tax=Pontiella agarivorans TaxID=3038953 RepID=A0ABU5N260_9BACT|nr:hypothetical protein [Pontiella agarivorans]MDZ8120534.1 hypothetical protein [Pontiella agarivorans]